MVRISLHQTLNDPRKEKDHVCLGHLFFKKWGVNGCGCIQEWIFDYFLWVCSPCWRDERARVLYCSNFLLEFRKLCIKWRTLHNVKKYKEVQSNLAVRNFLVTLKLFLNAVSSLSLCSKWQIGHRKWFLNTNLFLIKPFLIAKIDRTKVLLIPTH